MNGNLVHQPGSTAVKSSHRNGMIEGYLVTWGDATDTDLQGEFFTPRTNFCLDWFSERPALYHHGMDGNTGLKKIGTIKSIQQDDLGLWVQAQLNLRDEYAQAVYDMVKTSEFGWSSGSVDHLVKIADNGEIVVWPIIEGSVTPTPAQPAKTTIRALKSVLRDDKQYLRGLNRHLDRVNSSSLEQGSYRIAKKVADSLGVKANPHQIYRTANTVINSEIRNILADELEYQAGKKANNEETKMRIKSRPYARRRAWRNAQNDDEMKRARRRAMRRSRRNTDEALLSDDDPLAKRARRRAMRRSRRNTDEALLSDEIQEASMMDEMAKRARRSRSRHSFRNYVRNVGNDEALLSDDDPLAKRARRRAMRRSRRNTDEALLMEEEAAMMEEEAAMMEEEAAMAEEQLTKAMRRARRAMRRARRSTSRRNQVEEAMNTTEEIVKRARRSRSRRNTDEAYATEEEAMMSQLDEALAMMEEEAAASDDPTVTASLRRAARSVRQIVEEDNVGKRARRRAMRRSRRNTDEALLSDDDPLAKRARRRAMRRSRRNTDEALLSDDDPLAKRARRSRSRRNTDEALLSDDPLTKRARRSRSRRNTNEDEAMSAYRNYRGRRAKSAEYWRKRAMKAERAEAPGQRAFKSVKASGVSGVVDSADRPGAYKSVFMKYLRTGDRLLNDQERYTLEGKGKVRWGKSTMTYDPSNRSIKTYYGGTDSSVGFAVPPDWVAELNKNIMTETTMAPECKTKTTTSDVLIQPNKVSNDGRRSSAATVRWAREQIANPENEHRTTDDEFSQIEIPVHIMLISQPVSNSALEDVSFDLEAEINEAFSEAVAVSYDVNIWGGDGQGKPQGIVTNAEVTGHISEGVQTVSGYIPTGSNDGLVNADAIKAMMYHMPQGYRNRTKWFMNSNTGLQIATLKDGEGNYLIDQRDESLRTAGIPDTLLGRPIVYNEWASDIEQNAFPIVLGDLSRGYMIVKRVDFSIRRFDDSAYAEYDQVLFMGRARLGGQVLTKHAIKVLKVAEA